MIGPVALSEALLRMVGVAEALGACGVLLPGLLRIRPRLTPLAAVGLVVGMIGTIAATVMTASGGDPVAHR